MFGEHRNSINHRHLDDPYFSHKKVQCIDLSNNINMRKIYRFGHHREPASTVLTNIQNLWLRLRYQAYQVHKIKEFHQSSIFGKDLPNNNLKLAITVHLP